MLKLLFLCMVNIGLLLSLTGAARADATLLEQMILMEAAYEPLMGRVAVAAVALDRVADDRWPDSLYGVLSQRRQFTGLWGPQKKFRQHLVRGAHAAVHMARKGVRPCGPGVYWYHADYILPPSWASNLTVACHIGHHIFYRD